MSTVNPERLTSHELDQLLADERRIAQMARSLRRTQGLGELVRSLRELHGILETHFSVEEAPDGFFDMIRDRAAVHIARVEQCRREHVMLLREVDLILDRARACLAGPVAEIMKQADALAGRIEQHEAKERDLLGEAMSTDVGVGEGG